MQFRAIIIASRYIYALMHDPEREARAIGQSDPNDHLTKAETPLLQGYKALDQHDTKAAIAPLEAFGKIWRTDPNLQNYYVDNLCFLALAYGLDGRLADAEAVFKQAGPWSRCYAFHGDVLAHARDMAGAQRVWAEGLKIAPDLPQVYLHRGVYELDHGDLNGALGRPRRRCRQGPPLRRSAQGLGRCSGQRRPLEGGAGEIRGGPEIRPRLGRIAPSAGCGGAEGVIFRQGQQPTEAV